MHEACFGHNANRQLDPALVGAGRKFHVLATKASRSNQAAPIDSSLPAKTTRLAGSTIAQIPAIPNSPPSHQGGGTSMNDLSEITGLRRYPMARRGMMMTSLISGFTLATTRVEAQAIR